MLEGVFNPARRADYVRPTLHLSVQIGAPTPQLSPGILLVILDHCQAMRGTTVQGEGQRIPRKTNCTKGLMLCLHPSTTLATTILSTTEKPTCFLIFTPMIRTVPNHLNREIVTTHNLIWRRVWSTPNLPRIFQRYRPHCDRLPLQMPLVLTIFYHT